MVDHEEQLLAANTRFYSAFADGDLEAMNACWAQTTPAVCIHPGWALLVGRSSIMMSWRAILATRGGPPVECANPRAQLHDGIGMVICEERIGSIVLLATNLFVREKGQWALVHRHAAPVMNAGALPRTDNDDDSSNSPPRGMVN